MRRWLALLVLLASCGPGQKAGVTAPRASQAGCVKAREAPPWFNGPSRSGETGDLGDVRIRTERIATLTEPTSVAFRCSDETIYVTKRRGRVVAIRGGHPAQILDITSEVNTAQWEQGLLGIVFSPDGARMFLTFTDKSNDLRLISYAVTGGDIQKASRHELLTIPKVHPLHNGGNIVFGPDGMLYMSAGDGESPDNAQRLTILLGKILRLDPWTDPKTVNAAEGGPFAQRAGARPSIWTWGLRNPWRFSFDRASHDLWIGDVGDFTWEEISRVPFSAAPGKNFGWPKFEGTHPHKVWPVLKRLVPSLNDPTDPVVPVHEFKHGDDGCAVVGGHVYRGTSIGALRGVYVFGELCTKQLRGLVGTKTRVLSKLPGQPTSFGEAPDGELYVATRQPGGLYRIVEDA